MAVPPLGKSRANLYVYVSFSFLTSSPRIRAPLIRFTLIHFHFGGLPLGVYGAFLNKVLVAPAVLTI